MYFWSAQSDPYWKPQSQKSSKSQSYKGNTYKNCGAVIFLGAVWQGSTLLQSNSCLHIKVLQWFLWLSLIFLRTVLVLRLSLNVVEEYRSTKALSIFLISGHWESFKTCLNLVPLGKVPGTVGSAVGEHHNWNGLKSPSTVARKHFNTSERGSSHLMCPC